MKLSSTKYAQQFLTSEVAENIKKQLTGMENDMAYNTQSSYKPSELDGESFVDKHLNYLSMHPKAKPEEYMSNLRLRTKIRGHRN